MNRSRFAQLGLVSTLGFLDACNSSGGGGSIPVIPNTLSKRIFSHNVGGQNDLFLIKEDASGRASRVTLANSAENLETSTKTETAALHGGNVRAISNLISPHARHPLCSHSESFKVASSTL